MDSNQTSRRRFLGSLAAGGLALGAGLPAATAQEEEEPTEADHRDDAAVVETLELAAAAFYDEAVRSGAVQSPAALAQLADFGRHHRAHAEQFGELAGDKGTGEPNRRLLQTFLDQLEQTTGEPDALRLAFDFEMALTSTHLAQLNSLEDADLLAVVAAVLPVEAQHAAAVGLAAGLPTGTALPALENLDLALDVTQYPATTTTTTA